MKFLRILAMSAAMTAASPAAQIYVSNLTEAFDGYHGAADEAAVRLGAADGKGVIGRMTISDGAINSLVASGNLSALNAAFEAFGDGDNEFDLDSAGAAGAFESLPSQTTKLSSGNGFAGSSIYIWFYKGANRATAAEFFLAKMAQNFPTDGEDAPEPEELDLFVNPDNLAFIFSGTNGPETFDYGLGSGAVTLLKTKAVSDGTGNQPPVAEPSSIVAFTEVPRNGQMQGSDPENDALTFIVTIPPQNGNLVFDDTTGAFTYTSNVGYLGLDSFTFKVSDGDLESIPAVVTISVEPVPPNQAPVAQDAQFEVIRNDLLRGQLTATDAEGDALSYELVTAAQYGEIEVDADGSFRYRPESGYVGQDWFTFKASDGLLDSEVAMVLISVRQPSPGWTWMNGGSQPNLNGIYGSKGVSAAENSPGARTQAAVASRGGIQYVFGGLGRGASGGAGLLNDLWKFDSGANEWTWVAGDSVINAVGSYGVQGIAAPANGPGGRRGARMWMDDSGSLWLFGGHGRGVAAATGELNDLWKFDVSTGEWTWVKGSSAVNAVGVYGGAAGDRVPGGRADAASWMGADGRLWIFGGRGRAAASTLGNLGDLWSYDPQANEWEYVSGTDQLNAAGVYAGQQQETSGTRPGARSGAAAWVDAEGRFWVFGGNGTAAAGRPGFLDDLWVYRPGSKSWTWMKGSLRTNAKVVRAGLGVAAPELTPGARALAFAWTGADGRLYLFGGASSASQNDVWCFNPVNNEWGWLKGFGRPNAAGIYGEKGVASASNTPGARSGAVGFLSSENELWIFGGANRARAFNDTWRLELPKAAVITLDPLMGITDEGADVMGTLYANVEAGDTAVSVQYASLSAPGQWDEVAVDVLPPDAAPQGVMQTLEGLDEGSSYLVRLKAANAGGVSYSALRLLTTTGVAAPVSVQFAEAASSCLEGVGAHSLLVTLSAPAPELTSVPVTRTGGTAAAGAVSLVSSSVSFAVGQVQALVDLNVVDNAVAGPDQTVELTLGAPTTGSASLGGQTSHVVTIEDDDSGPVVEEQPQSQVVALGQAVRLEVQASGDGPLTYQWKKNGRVIRGAVSSSYLIPAARLADAGEFSVDVRDARRLVTASAGAQVAVVDTQFRRVVAARNSSPTLSFAFSGSGLAFGWTKGADPLVLGTASSLAFPVVQTTATGAYECLVSLPGAGQGLVVPFSLRVTTTGASFAGQTRLPNGRLGSSYEYQLLPTNAPEGDAETYSFSGLPRGLRGSVSGLITGVPTQSVVDRRVTVTARNAAGPVVAYMLVTIEAVPQDLVGSYFAAVPAQEGLGDGLGGRFDVVLSAKGSYTAQLQMGGKASAARGALEVTADGAAGVASFARKGSLPVKVHFELVESPGVDEPELVARIEDALTESEAVFSGVKLAAPAPAQVAVHSFGLVLEDGWRGALAVPQGSGFGMATVAATGRVNLAGRTADGGTYTSGRGMGRTGEIAVYALAAVAKVPGVLAGSATVVPATGVGEIDLLEGELSWARAAAPVRSKLRAYPAGFGPVNLAVEGSAYQAPASGGIIGNLAAGANNVTLSFESRSLVEAPIADYAFTIANGGGVRQVITRPAPNPAGVDFRLNPRLAGGFTGSFTVVGSLRALNRRATFAGVFVSQAGAPAKAYGFYLLPEAPEPGQSGKSAPELSGDVFINP